MADDRATELIAGCFEVELARPLPGAGGGLPAFAALDRVEGRQGLMAVQVRRAAPPRAGALFQLARAGAPGILSPLGHGPARDPSGALAWFVVCPAPPGPALLAPDAREFRPWGERELVDGLVRPVARALEALHGRHLTHRALRPDNLFRAGPADPVTLGCAWAAPPAALQPALYEPPYVAMCHPAGRGEGSIADDMYALGVILLALACGRLPMAGLTPAQIIARKLELGSFAALAGEERLPPLVMDLARGLLAEDPDHRPPPALLADPGGARSRRVAARPPRRAQRPLEVGAGQAWTARTLAHAIATDPAAGVRALRGGAVDRWIRRSLGDGLLAARLEEIVRLRGMPGEQEDPREDAALAMRAVASLDPLAPLCWSGLAFWPDGLGPLLAAEEPAGTQELLADIIAMEGIALWAGARPERCDVPALRLEAHQHRATLRQRGWGGGLERLRYALNPLLAARSPLLRGALVVRLPELLPALDHAAAQAAPAAGQMPVDHDLAAFAAARSDQRLDAELVAISDGRHPAQAALALLRLYAALQARQRIPLPGLAGWLAGLVAPALGAFQSRAARRQREEALAGLAAAGQLAALLALIEDPQGSATDRAAHQAALARVAEIDRELAALRAGAAARGDNARRLAQDAVAAAGALGLMLAIMFGLFA